MTDTNITKISTLAGALALITTAIAGQNAIEVVSAEIEKIKGDGAPKGSRVHLVLQGDGVADATRRYFLRENSAFAATVRDTGLFMGAPKMARGSAVYDLYFALTEDLATWQPAPPAKVAKEKMTPEQRSAARLAGKTAARERRASEAAARAESIGNGAEGATA